MKNPDAGWRMRKHMYVMVQDPPLRSLSAEASIIRVIEDMRKEVEEGEGRQWREAGAGKEEEQEDEKEGEEKKKEERRTVEDGERAVPEDEAEKEEEEEEEMRRRRECMARYVLRSFLRLQKDIPRYRFFLFELLEKEEKKTGGGGGRGGRGGELARGGGDEGRLQEAHHHHHHHHQQQQQQQQQQKQPIQEPVEKALASEKEVEAEEEDEIEGDDEEELLQWKALSAAVLETWAVDVGIENLWISRLRRVQACLAPLIPDLSDDEVATLQRAMREKGGKGGPDDPRLPPAFVRVAEVLRVLKGCRGRVRKGRRGVVDRALHMMVEGEKEEGLFKRLLEEAAQEKGRGMKKKTGGTTGAALEREREDEMDAREDGKEEVEEEGGERTRNPHMPVPMGEVCDSFVYLPLSPLPSCPYEAI